jgi:hypothetical protein
MTTIILYTLGVIVAWIVFYYVVKAAVRNGIREAQSSSEVISPDKEDKLESTMTPKQVELQRQYDKGQITFEVFQSDWNKQ